jgi:hypothetical protein
MNNRTRACSADCCCKGAASQQPSNDLLPVAPHRTVWAHSAQERAPLQHHSNCCCCCCCCCICGCCCRCAAAVTVPAAAAAAAAAGCHSTGTPSSRVAGAWRTQGHTCSSSCCCCLGTLQHSLLTESRCLLRCTTLVFEHWSNTGQMQVRRKAPACTAPQPADARSCQPRGVALGWCWCP